MIQLETIHTARFELQTRMPFRYGIATMTRLPHLLVRAEFRFGNRSGVGFAGDHLPPRWFRKDPVQSPEEEIDEMLRVIGRAVAFAREIESPDAFAFWRQLYNAQGEWAAAEGLPPLLAHFGTSLVERALLDALCMAHASPLHEAFRRNLPGIRLEALDPSLAGWQPSDALASPPVREVLLRHTVGLSDPILTADIPGADRLADGLPQSLEEVIAGTGAHHFKLKINAQWDIDLPRLESIFSLLTKRAPADWRFTLDGNENFSDAASFREYWQRVVDLPFFAPCLDRLLFVEQPIRRSAALGPDASWRDWPGAPPILIDESDGDLDSLPRALDLGYAGVSHKNCKGIIRGLLNRARIKAIGNPDRRFTSAEDLTNIGPVALPQDLLMQALLGNRSVERNGHHYFEGLSMWPDDVQQAVADDHPDLFLRDDRDRVRLDSRGGRLRLASLHSTGFALGNNTRSALSALITDQARPLPAD